MAATPTTHEELDEINALRRMLASPLRLSLLVILRRDRDDFYDLRDGEEFAATIRGMHPVDLTESRDQLARFLSGWLGGPKRYREKYGSIAIPAAHSHLAIDDPERLAWLECMRLAIERHYRPK